MQVEVNGTRLWFEVDGSVLVPEGSRMRQRPTVVVLHGGPGSYDHSYLKSDFAPLVGHTQVVYLDLRGHGRSEWGDPADWSFEVCADDLRAFCDTLGIVRPVVYGHSMGGFIAMLYGARHPGHAAALVLQSTHARFDLARLVEGFRRFGGDEVAELVERDYGGHPVSDAEWARVFAVFGPKVPGPQQLARRISNPELGTHGMGAVPPLRRRRAARGRRLPHPGLRWRAGSGHPGGRRPGGLRRAAARDRAARGDQGGRPFPVEVRP
jgi:pimeloyl-ACP methyl ester carboxylesterase